MICLPEIETAELSTFGNFARCHQAHFRVLRVGLGMRLRIIILPMLSSTYLQLYTSNSQLYSSDKNHGTKK